MSYLLRKTLVFSIICSNWKKEEKKKLKQKNQLKHEKLLVYLKIYNYFENMVKERVKSLN